MDKVEGTYVEREVSCRRMYNTQSDTLICFKNIVCACHTRVQASLAVAEGSQWVVSASLLWLICVTVLQHVTGGGGVFGISLFFLTIAWEPARYLHINKF